MKLSKLGIFAELLLCLFLEQSCTTQDGIKENNNSRNVTKLLPNGMVDLSFSIIKVIKRSGIEYCYAYKLNRVLKRKWKAYCTNYSEKDDNKILSFVE
jgi:hypothetical protein